MMTNAQIGNLNNAHIEDERFLSADNFAVSSGNDNPSKDNDPGLIYDIEPGDYVPNLCGLKYTNRQMNVILQPVLKSAHSNWFPAAIKSAMMTTSHIANLNNAPIEDERFLPANNFAVGSGHVNLPRLMILG
ncbi:unnamed protein product [Fraxinus pennsylvanica]|uniref:Uncharacterized protein n=1 Tax=Fraxinus pennsylvanica TaxID=56036 RepID=A0AAD1Z898_9LAMI|nr:unnamed protein product [Fraxinus pennsylvanica]